MSAKYFIAGLKHRADLNEFLEMQDKIELGEDAVLRDCRGILMSREKDGTSTVKLLPCEMIVKLTVFAMAQLRRREPILDTFLIEQQKDVVPKSTKVVIDAFFWRYVPISPNKRDSIQL